MTDEAGLFGVPNLEDWWAEFQSTLPDRGMALYPLTEWPRNSGVEWPDDRSIEEFMSVASAVGVRLVYALPRRLEKDTTTVVAGEDVESHEGDLAYVAVWWIHESVRHACTVYSDWYLPIINKAVEDSRASREAQEAAREAQESKVPEMAAELARNPVFNASPGGASGRIHAARSIYPDLPDEVIRRVAQDAWLIYGTEVLPEQERSLVVKARALMASGVAVTAAARQVGVSRDRLGRMLALYADSKEADRIPDLPTLF